MLQQRQLKQQNQATLAALQQNAIANQQQLAALQQNVAQLQQLEQVDRVQLYRVTLDWTGEMLEYIRNMK